MILKLLTALLSVAMTLPLAQADDDYYRNFDSTPWLGKSRTSLDAELKTYGNLCQRQVLHELSKFQKDFSKAQVATDRICQCNGAYFRKKNDVQFVQTVNLDIRGGRAALSPLPRELSMYLLTYLEVQKSCVIAHAKEPTVVRKVKAQAHRRTQLPGRFPSSEKKRR